VIDIYRHVYQTCLGGTTYVPCDKKSRFITQATPRLAKIIGYKYARGSAKEVAEDLKLSNNISYTATYIQDLYAKIATICEDKEDKWSYDVDKEVLKEVDTVVVSRDGAMVPIINNGYREAMAGTISLHDNGGNRLTTIYVASAPEYGKEKFDSRMNKALADIKTLLPDAMYVGLADGAANNWTYLNEVTDLQILDYFHASEYIAKFVSAYFADEKVGQKWYEKTKDELKNKDNSIVEILAEMKKMLNTMPLGINRQLAEKTVVYIENNQGRMNYAHYKKVNVPIGSGVVEAACKTLIKQRCCRAGARWTIDGLDKLLRVRQLVLTNNRWDQFWGKLDRYGF
jgi:hypothetical protein